MAWQVVRRAQRSVEYQNDTQPDKRAIDMARTALHYESALDSGEYDTPVDATPQRVQNEQLDGWRITDNDWHYALGQPGDKATDGWVGFGGRQGAHWLLFRLEQFGWLHWPERDFTQIGGTATYNRQNLNNQINSITLDTTGESIPVESVATWGGLWSTPGGGDVSVRWRVNGDGLKEDITLNQAGRTWIANNAPPSTPLEETYFTWVFELDHSGIPRWVKNGLTQDVSGDFDDDSGTIELQDTAERLLAFLPVDDAIVLDAEGDEIARQRLRKRIYTTGGATYLLVGMRADHMAALPDGLLVFDPTIDQTIGALDLEAEEADGAFNANPVSLRINNNSAFYYGGWHFSPTVPQGATIDVAYLSLYVRNTNNDTFDADFFCEDADDAKDFNSFSGTLDIDSRPRTTASALWDTETGAGGYHDTPSLVSPVQEVVDRAGWASGNGMLFISEANVDTVKGEVRTYNFDPAQAAKLHIEYTEAGGGDPAPNVSDSASASDTPTLTTSAPQASASDTSSIADTPTAQLVNSIWVSDTTSLSDTPVVTASDPQAVVSDSVAVADTPTTNLTIGISVNDSAGITDTPTVDAVLSIIVSDAAGLNDTLTQRLLSHADVSDAASIADAPTLTTSALQIDASDAASVSDTPTVSVEVFDAVSVNVSDAVGVSDTPSVRLLSYIAATDTASLADTPVQTVSVPQVSVTDSASLTDTPTVNAVAGDTATISVSDAAVVADTLTLATSALGISVSDATSITDSPTVRLLVAVSVSDTAGLNDTPIVAIGALAVSVSDGVAVAELRTVAISAPAVTVADAVDVADSATVVPGVVGALNISITDAVGLLDDPTVANPLLPLSVNDSTHVADAPTVGGDTKLVTVSDSISLSDVVVVMVAAVVVPASRTHTIAGEGRTFIIPNENRTFVVS